MKTLKIGVCILDEKDNIISKKVIGKKWYIDDNYNDMLLSEISSITSDYLKNNIKPIILKEMLLEIKSQKGIK